MSETKHTPGPWRVGFPDGSGARESRGICITADGTYPGSLMVVRANGCCESSRNGVFRKEDARLIAAAPDLLKAAEGALVWVALATGNEDLNIENAKTDLLALQLAITKAGGNAGRGIDEEARAAIAAAEGAR